MAIVAEAEYFPAPIKTSINKLVYNLKPMAWKIHVDLEYVDGIK